MVLAQTSWSREDLVELAAVVGEAGAIASTETIAEGYLDVTFNDDLYETRFQPLEVDGGGTVWDVRTGVGDDDSQSPGLIAWLAVLAVRQLLFRIGVRAERDVVGWTRDSVFDDARQEMWVRLVEGA